MEKTPQHLHWPYWIAQLGGWSFYYTLSLLSNYITGQLNSTVFIALSVILVIGLLTSHIYRSFILGREWLKRPLQRNIFPVFLATTLMAVFMALTQIVLSWALINFTKPLSEQFNSEVFLVWLNWWIIFMIWSLMYFAYHFFQKSRNEEIRNLRFEAMRSEVELNNLKAQLNPHFMFNSMNSIRALVDENPELAKESITKLSSILRNTLIMGRKKLVSLREELEVVGDYLKLESIRYEERLQVSLVVDDELQSALIPPLMIQTLVENAIKHGISKLTHGGEIQVLVMPEGEDMLFIQVRNSGQFKPSSGEGTGIGLENTRQRLELLFGTNFYFHISQEGDMVNVIIKLPKIHHYESNPGR